MSLPPAFTKAYYVKLAALAKEFKTSRVAFALQALDYYAAALRKKKSVSTKALGSVDLAEQYSEMTSKVSKSWWAKQTPQEKEARAKKAAAARWQKKRRAGHACEEVAVMIGLDAAICSRSAARRPAIRARRQKMDDDELKRYGKTAASLHQANPGRPPRETFAVQLPEARAECRRRNPA